VSSRWPRADCVQKLSTFEQWRSSLENPVILTLKSTQKRPSPTTGADPCLESPILF